MIKAKAWPMLSDDLRQTPDDADPSGTSQRQMEFILGLRKAGVTSKDVLKAIESTPRDFFLEGTFKARAWDDTALPIACGQTISQPSIVGLMTQALDLNRRCKVLEIGTGSGYQAAILSPLSRRVYTVERHRNLARAARERLDKLGLTNVTVITGDGTRGLPEQAPFDRIIVTAAPEDPPANLLAQLGPGGIMVLPVGQSDHVQQLIKITRTETGFDYHEICDVRFVPLVEGVAD